VGIGRLSPDRSLRVRFEVKDSQGRSLIKAPVDATYGRAVDIEADVTNRASVTITVTAVSGRTRSQGDCDNGTAVLGDPRLSA